MTGTGYFQSGITGNCDSSGLITMVEGQSYECTIVNDDISPNDPPVANDDDFYSTSEDVALTIDAPGVLANDTDEDGDSLSVFWFSAPSNGTLVLNNDGSFSYNPSANYNSTDSFTYKTSDGEDLSSEATVTITVEPENDAPVALADSYSTNEDTMLSKSAAEGILSNDSDVEGDSLSVVLVDDVSHGTLTLNPDGSFDYTPVADYQGEDLFTYKANDGSEDSNVVTVSIDVSNENDAPVAVADSYSTDEDTALNIPAPGVLANDSDVDVGDSISVGWDTLPANGTLGIGPDGSFIYTPDLNFYGEDSFTYKASDGDTYSGEVTVSITVNPVEDAPSATSAELETDEDTPIIDSVSATDEDGDALTYAVVTPPEHGTLELNEDGSFKYTPDENYHGTDSFTFSVSDGSSSDEGAVSIMINPINDAPVAVNDTYSTEEDAELNIAAPGVLENDSDVDSSSLWAEVVAGVSNGSLTFNGSGSFTYTPNADFKGTDSFTYIVKDSDEINGTSNIATVAINVGDVNDAPVADDQSVSIDEDTSATVTMTATDADGDTLTYSIVMGPSNGTLSGIFEGNKVTYTPNANYFGTDSFTYKAHDGTESENSDSNVATVSIIVDPVNDAPTLTLLGSSSMSLTQGGTFTDPGATADDVEDGDLTESIVTSGAVDVNTASTYYINYSVTDSGELSAHAVRTVVVNPKSPSGGGGSTGGGTSSGGGGAMIVKPTIIITNENVVNLGGGKAKVTWTTNIETTEQVVYGDNSVAIPGAAPKYGYDSLNTESDFMVKEHSVIISGLVDGTIYYFRPVADRLGSTGEVVGKEVSNLTEQGEVKGISDTAPVPVPVPVAPCNYLNGYIKFGGNNDPEEVRKLETFLNEFEGENLIVNGIYEQADFDAVSRFQEKYSINVLSPWKSTEPTGYVYITTKKRVNEIYCQREFTLTQQQLAEIAAFGSRILGIGNAGAQGADGSTSSTTPASGENAGNPSENASENGENAEGESGTVKGAASEEGAEKQNDDQKQTEGQSGSNSGNMWIGLILILLVAGVIYYVKKGEK